MRPTGLPLAWVAQISKPGAGRYQTGSLHLGLRKQPPALEGSSGRTSWLWNVDEGRPASDSQNGR